MIGGYVRLMNAWDRLRRALRPENGMTMIEYGVFAAFVVVILVGAAMTIGDELSDWLKDTIWCITGDDRCSKNITAS